MQDLGDKLLPSHILLQPLSMAQSLRAGATSKPKLHPDSAQSTELTLQRQICSWDSTGQETAVTGDRQDGL